MDKLSTKAGFKEIESIFFALQATTVCRHQWLVQAKSKHDFQKVSVASSSRRPALSDYPDCSLEKQMLTWFLCRIIIPELQVVGCRLKRIVVKAVWSIDGPT